jgi:PTH1 family peptidyl-tRNA hydrolase
MKILIGLGNPEGEYAKTRHNIGKDFLEMLREKLEMPAWDKNKSLNADVSKDSERGIVLIKPNVYMNDSGSVASKALKFFDTSASDLILVYDELDLLAGEYKLSFQKHSKIHNGVNSVISALGQDDFLFLRLGVRDESIPFSVQQAGKDPAKYVLAKIPSEDFLKIKNCIKDFVIPELEAVLSKKL